MYIMMAEINASFLQEQKELMKGQWRALCQIWRLKNNFNLDVFKILISWQKLSKML